MEIMAFFRDNVYDCKLNCIVVNILMTIHDNITNEIRFQVPYKTNNNFRQNIWFFSGKNHGFFFKIILTFLGILFNKNIKKIISHFMMEKLEIFYMTD